MKFLYLITILFTLSGCSTMEVKKQNNKLSFNEVWNQVKSDPLKTLPQEKVSFFKLYSDGKDVISHDAKRTLEDDSDILESFNKLAHPNGICFKGVWEIDSDNIFSGYFKNGTKTPIIARASTAMSHTTNDSTRAFGFAGKLFSTTSENKKSANFFLIEDLGGTDAKHYTDAVLSNEPSVSFSYEVLKNIAYAIKVSNAFSQADKHPTIRQLYEISSLDETKNIITPKWMKIEAKNPKQNNKKDFRDELTIADGENLIFNIFVANKKVDEKKVWQKIGAITLNSSVVSESCDHRLHFHHPKWRDDLKYRDD